ncbi:unnamed protein product, partial [Gulo gulo]
KNYWCRKETKKKQAQRERVTRQSGAKHKWSICAFRNHPLEHRDGLLPFRHGAMSSHSVFLCVYFAKSFLKR